MGGRSRYKLVMALFDELCDLPPAERAPRLEALRRLDAPLAAEVESLLAHDQPEAPRLEAAAEGIARLAGELSARPTLLAPEAPAGPTGAFLGHTVDGWHIEQSLGSGGHGEVYRARDAGGAVVAIKFLRRRDEAAERRFRREFLAVQRLEHPGCVKVFAEGVHAGTRYIVMEYVAGGDLERLIGAPDDLLIGVLLQICETLAYVHSRGVVHRDLKPANVLLAPGESFVPRLADFGIAKIFDENLSALSLQGRLVGTIDYLAPEQVHEEPVGPASDLYSLGCMMHVLWAGSPPFDGDGLSRLSARLSRDAPRLAERAPRVPEAIDRLVARLLRREPEERPGSAAEVAAALRAQ
jgi:serine/threonine protein kinase